MGKTFRRGGSEYGNNSYGKSLRDKRAKGSKRYSRGFLWQKSRKKIRIQRKTRP